MSPEPAVSVHAVSKTFALPRHRAWTIKERLRHPIASLGHDRLEALRDVSFEVEPGEFFAIIGRNGSGKSTLLRCIAGIHEPDAGELDVRARLAPFIELGVGFNPQLNARDNVIVAGTLMGLRPAEARRRFPRVIAFAELEEFADMQLGNYSSGMQVRLAFSTSFQVDAEVLLFDEVLAVGDELFQRKCRDTFERLISEGHTIVYVSHSLETIRKFADRVLLLDHGRTIALGEPEPVLAEYERRNRERERSGGLRLGEADGHVEIVEAWLESEPGVRTSVLHQGEQTSFRFTARVLRDMERPTLGFAVRDRDGKVVLSETDRWRRSGREVSRAGQVHTFSANFPMRLDPGAYEASPLLALPDDTGLLELRDDQIELRVEEGPASSERAAPPPSGGPTGRWGELRRFLDVTLTLGRADFKLRYLDSFVGYAWALAQPLLTFAVLYVVWDNVFGRHSPVHYYALKLLLGIALFTFFTESTGQALPSLVTKGTMLRKIWFPPVAVPLASVLTSVFVYGSTLAVVLGFVAALGHPPKLDWLELVPLLALLLGFTVGVSMLLSIVYVDIRDLAPIWVVVNRLLFFMTPVFYPIEAAPPGLQHALMLNPLAVVIVQARHALIDSSAPTAVAAAGGGGRLAISLAIAAGVLLAGILLYRTRARAVAERI